MKQWFSKSIQVCALLIALAISSFAEESKRGFYEANLAGGRMANISTRGFVNAGQGQLIGGFIIRGGPKMVFIRALRQSARSEISDMPKHVPARENYRGRGFSRFASA